MKKLEPFKFFCLQNFPFIEEDFDALTNYELMCKIIEYLNRNIEKTNELGIQVQNLVDWFNNLDVQEEIDNKLDDMAESGELAEIINQEIFGELNTRLTAVENTENPIGFYSGKNMVVFGDSFTDPINNNSLNGFWVNRVATVTGMTAFNFAKGGASVCTRPNNSYRMQLSNAQSNMTSEEKDNTRVVIMYLADTDILETCTVDQYVTEYLYLCSNIVTTFPKAKIIVVPFTWRCDQLLNTHYTKMTEFIWHMKRNTINPVIFGDYAMFWLLGLKGYFQNEYHPNQTGYTVIADKFINLIYGGTAGDTTDYYNVSLNSLTNISNDSRCTVQVQNGKVTVEFYATFTDEKTDYLEEFSMPYVAYPQPDIFAGLYIASGELVGTARIKSVTGEMQLNIHSLTANTPIFMQPLNYRECANFVWS